MCKDCLEIARQRTLKFLNCITECKDYMKIPSKAWQQTFNNKAPRDDLWKEVCKNIEARAAPTAELKSMLLRMDGRM